MSRYRLYPTPAQAEVMTEYCAHARFVWNLAVEQFSYQRPGRRCPTWVEQCRQLTEARSEFKWLADGSRVVQSQAIRDFDQAMKHWRKRTHGRPTWRKKGEHEGFRIEEGNGGLKVRKLNRKWSTVKIPKIGQVRFRCTRAAPTDPKSFRVKRDAAGRWFIAFVAIPETIDGPSDQSVVGIDRGVVVTLACSDGTVFQAPPLRSTASLQRRLCRAKRGSSRRKAVKLQLAKLHARNVDRRKDFVEKATTSLARNYDLIRIEDLRIKNMTRSAKGTVEVPGTHVRAKAAMNRSILAGGWGLFAERLQDKAPGRVEKVRPFQTSQRCSSCGHVDPNSRKSQALFECTSCGYVSNADLNAACNIAAGRAVRGAEIVSALRRVPQHVASPAA